MQPVASQVRSTASSEMSALLHSSILIHCRVSIGSSNTPHDRAVARQSMYAQGMHTLSLSIAVVSGSTAAAAAAAVSPLSLTAVMADGT
jgi:hypothetical protein